MQPVIIGGGWSGLSAAVYLAKAGQKPLLLEAAKQLGGRARSVQWQNTLIDNGQHLMIGAYRHMLDLIHCIGVDEQDVFHRKTLELSIFDPLFPAIHFSASKLLPWPLALLPKLYQSLGWRDLMGFLRFFRTLHGSRITPDMTVEQWCEQSRQSSRLVTQLWTPLCLAIMNTPIQLASASVFAKTLHDSLGAGSDAADLLIPVTSLGGILPAPAQRYITAHNGDVRLQTRVDKILVEAGKVAGVITNHGEVIVTDNVIVAVPPSMLSLLVGEPFAFAPVTENPIITIYLQFTADFRLKAPMMGFSNVLPQWLFDRSDLSPGLMAVVISGPGEHESLTKQQLIDQVVSDMKGFLPDLPAQYLSVKVIHEKRATFSCSVAENNQRPGCKSHIQGLLFAGDYAENPYPATLEGAVINGYRAAKTLLTGNFP